MGSPQPRQKSKRKQLTSTKNDHLHSTNEKKKNKTKIGNSTSSSLTIALCSKLCRWLCTNGLLLAMMMMIVGMGVLFVIITFTRSSKRQSPVDTWTKVPSSSYREPIVTYPHFEVLEILPHDPLAFTQGLTFNGTTLWEGTGMYGKSELRHIYPSTGHVLDSYPLDSTVFGEGIAWFMTRTGHGRIVQITWRERRGYTYDATTLQPVLHHETSHRYPQETNDNPDIQNAAAKGWTFETSTGEGWGITYDPDRHSFWVTDGSSTLHEWDAETRQEKQRLTVVTVSQADGRRIPVNKLNEIEYIGNNRILSNVWYEDIIVKIHLETGIIEQIYDFSKLYVNRAEGTDCFNGISITDTENEYWVTGKYWPHMYRVRLLK
jgi:glutaminyl-peptide cyclotransferase